MNRQINFTWLLLLSALFVSITGCVSSPSGPIQSGDNSDPRPSARVAGSESVEPEPAGGMDGVFADRRRSDYPEIETEEFGFTITEQIRIAGDSYSRYDQALGLLQQGRYEEAIARLVELTENAPEITAPYVDLGIAYRHIGDLERAASALETAALLSPEHPIAHNELGIVYRRSGRFSEARAEYEKALSVFSEFHFARRNLAVLCDLYLADVECALQNYQLYLDSVGADPEVEIWIADLSARTGQNFQGALR